MDYIWIDIDDRSKSMVMNGSHALMEVLHKEGKWIVIVLGCEVSKKGDREDMQYAKQFAEAELARFMSIYGFSLDGVPLPNVSENFRRNRKGLVHEIDYMFILLRRVLKEIIGGKLSTKNITGWFDVKFSRSLADDICNYLFTKDKVIRKRKDIIRIVTLGKQGKIKNISWTDLLERFER